MHFVICVFIALICLATTILFTEVFPKWFKIILTVIGSFTTGYAISILIRKISIWTGAFAKPQLLSTAGIATVIVLIGVIVAMTMIHKKKA